MDLWLFLLDIFTRYGIAITVDAWYYSAVMAIGFLPVDQINAILVANGHSLPDGGTFCGLSVMVDDGQFNRTVPQIWIAEPTPQCAVSTLRYSIEHELRHVLYWIRDGLAVWPGH